MPDGVIELHPIAAEVLRLVCDSYSVESLDGQLCFDLRKRGGQTVS